MGTKPHNRAHRRRSSSAFVSLLALLTGFGLAAVVTKATGIDGGDRVAQGRTSITHRQPSAAQPRPRQTSGTRRTLSSEDRSIDSTLRYTPFIASGTRRKRVMALTFDDGPSPYTEGVVNVLVRMHVPATFFVVGQQLNDFADGLRDELRHGFEIGDHTENHAWLIHLSAAGQLEQVRDDAIRIHRFGAPYPRLFRPPYGAYNHQTLVTLQSQRMLMVLWSIDPGDWRRPGVPAIVDNVLDNSKPGAVVIMHDGGGDRSQTIAALPSIIRGLHRRHYTLVSLPELLTLDPPPRHQRVPTLGAA